MDPPALHARPSSLPVILALATLLAGCEAPPQPFAPDPVSQMLVNQQVGATLVVHAPGGADETDAGFLADAIVAGLDRIGVPATRSEPGGPNTQALFGDLALEHPANAPPVAGLLWFLTGPDGSLRHSFKVSAGTGDPQGPAKAMAGTGLSPVLLQQLAGESVTTLAAFMSASPVSPARPDAVWVTLLPGAPGDGQQALLQAMTAVLRSHNVSLADRKEDSSLTLQGRITQGPPRPAADGQATAARIEDITVEWELLGADGKPVGTVRQQNSMPAGILDRRWGDTALDVALAAWEGIANLLEAAR